ncbi:hypothetical protein L1887_08928 [Cichorium endivia]|nr:hypothetical protein L1887_08928 [Cichorium endivia]
MNINRYAWVADKNDTEFTNYPAQVRVRVRQQCHPLSENQFGPVIAENYYEKQLFYFELDHNQTNKLISLFTSSPVYSRASSSSLQIPSSFPVHAKIHSSNAEVNQTSGLSYASVVGGNKNNTTGKWSALFTTESTFEAENKSNSMHENTWEDAEGDKTWESDWSSEVNTIRDEVPLKEEQDELLEESQLVETAINEAECVQLSSSQPLDDIPDRQVSSSGETSQSEVEEKHEEDNNTLVQDRVEEIDSVNLESLVVKLKEEVEVMKQSQMKNIENINLLEQQLVKSKLEMKQLRNRIDVLESGSRSVEVDSNQQQSKSHSQFSNSVFIVGGFDGSSWLSSLESYFPCYDIKVSHNPMNFLKMYATSATMNGELYNFGGIGSHTVESFNPRNNQWVPRPPLYWKNIQVAGASINDKLFAVGGCKGCQISSDVEYLDLNIGKWLPIHSMNEKRSGPAAVQLNNALYITGGFDGKSYSSSVERLDPREEKWSKLADMNKRKGCHSMVVLNEKLYTLGGFDGENYVKTVECFDARMGCWVESEPMNVCRANFSAFVVGEKVYALGGSRDNNEVLDVVECFKEGSCWEVTGLKGIGKRSHYSAIVL